MLWNKVDQNNDVTFVGAIYHPPKPIYKTADLLDHIEEAVLRMQQDFPDSHVILAGDLNAMPNSEIVIRIMHEVTGHSADEMMQLSRSGVRRPGVRRSRSFYPP